MKALVFERKELKYAVAAIGSRLSPGFGSQVGPLRLKDIDPPEIPGDGWERVFPLLSGICGSDLATVDGRSSRYFEPLVSFPFVPGHEVFGQLEDGTRVVLEPVLGAESRGEDPPFEGACPGDGNDYGYLLNGPIGDGIQVGYCCDTGGGWSTQLVAHSSQLHEVPSDISDEGAVILEPAAVGVHTALKAKIESGDVVVVQGAGTMGLCATAALRELTDVETIIVSAKYPLQKSLAKELGADLVVEPKELKRSVRKVTGCKMIGNSLSGGADVTIDAVGNAGSIGTSLSITRPRGRVVMMGMPGVTKVDLTALWHRELEIVGSYTYGTELLSDGKVTSSYALAFDLVRRKQLGKLVSASYTLDRYKDAIRHAAEAGSLGAIKVVFDMREEKRR
ncbi:MAG: zinc-binding dehydrogenase [Acidimicrobiales bacterium]|nr:zinc-binding dehydrogenase [Acidimicrobiales bacterium]MDP6298625.1 zinc-binding dehydrogenase [Acidimicrobiales bacterium]HJM27715.1 zinc-binding dehydrogenase [Acidimicrobiales bacterium]HJM98463.1 zinc-binding dehydrogenase [Acidimicrobiales bacterium]